MRTTLQAVSERQFDHVVETSTVPVLVEFWKLGCSDYHALTGELERVQEDVGSNLLILTMNVEKNHQIPAELEITSPPRVCVLSGQRVQKIYWRSREAGRKCEADWAGVAQVVRSTRAVCL